MSGLRRGSQAADQAKQKVVWPASHLARDRGKTVISGRRIVVSAAQDHDHFIVSSANDTRVPPRGMLTCDDSPICPVCPVTDPRLPSAISVLRCVIMPGRAIARYRLPYSVPYGQVRAMMIMVCLAWPGRLCVAWPGRLCVALTWPGQDGSVWLCAGLAYVSCHDRADP